MPPTASHEATRLLAAWRDGDAAALAGLIALLYDELHAIAAREAGRERRFHTLTATALVAELYLRLAGQRAVPTERLHFLAVAAQAMRRLLVDHARARLREKRGGGQAAVPLEDVTLAAEEAPERLLALDEALTRLEARHTREAHALAYRYFGGLEVEDVAAVLGVSRATAFRDLQFARAWLHRALN